MTREHKKLIKRINNFQKWYWYFTRRWERIEKYCELYRDTYNCMFEVNEVIEEMKLKKSKTIRLMSAELSEVPLEDLKRHSIVIEKAIVKILEIEQRHEEMEKAVLQRTNRIMK